MREGVTDAQLRLSLYSWPIINAPRWLIISSQSSVSPVRGPPSESRDPPFHRPVCDPFAHTGGADGGGSVLR